MPGRLFDIFSGYAEEDAVWLEAVEGLSNARERMQAIAAEKSGSYFLYSSDDHSILAKIETFGTPKERVLDPD